MCGEFKMAIVFCRSCKTKITQRDTTCPKCGSPNSRIIPILMCIVLSSAGFVLYTAFQEVVRKKDGTVTVEKSSVDLRSQSTILQTGLADE